MPKSACYRLIWSFSSQAYELYMGQGDDVLDLVLDSSAWSGWVSQLSSFAFHGHNGSYTARKEHRRQGGQYWYAYARVAGKLVKRYLGRGTELTLTRLEQVARTLWLEPQAAMYQEERKASSRPRPASPTPPERKTEHRSAAGDYKAEVPPVLSGLPLDTLFASKLQVPRPRPYLVHRPRLLQQLQHGLERSLILLSAPAGFGKSTLLADWLASRGLPFAWLSLDPQDNEPGHFFSYLLAALQTTDPRRGVGKGAQASPYQLQLPPVESLLTALINELQARSPGGRDHVVLVLDDYHVITNEALHAALRFLLERLPPQLHLVLSTREDPPLPLARLRGRDALLELRAADLQFTPEETTTFFVQVMGLPLSAQERALLHARTEGWITGLHLAALSLQGRDDPSGFIATFSGGHHYVADYLLDEVLSRQSQDVQDFLLQTSILERLSAPLCDAVRARHDSQAQLGFLEQANLFVARLDDERRWYRYHQLFAQVLRHRLQHTAPGLILDLHLRASRWYEQHGFLTEAVFHALAVPAFEEAARLIEQYIETFLAGSQLQMLLEWLAALPETLILARPELCLIHALVLMDTNQLEAAAARLQTAEQGMHLGEEGCRGLLARLSGDRTGALAEPEGYIDEGPPALRLLREAQRQGLAPASVAKLLRLASKQKRSASQLPAPQPSLLVEPLTARERDVLQLLPDGASNQEIACQLTLSVNTVKKHVLNICGKLNVQRRAQAIAKARMLHLL